jgi:hypothetical protein
MSRPFVLISTSSIKEGKLDEYKAFTSKMAKIIEENEPRLRAFSTSSNEEGTKVTTVQVHPDADSFVFHLQIVREKMNTAFEHIKLESAIISGEVNDQVLEMMKQFSDAGVRVDIFPEILGGFARQIEG